MQAGSRMRLSAPPRSEASPGAEENVSASNILRSSMRNLVGGSSGTPGSRTSQRPASQRPCVTMDISSMLVQQLLPSQEAFDYRRTSMTSEDSFSTRRSGSHYWGSPGTEAVAEDELEEGSEDASALPPLPAGGFSPPADEDSPALPSSHVSRHSMASSRRPRGSPGHHNSEMKCRLMDRDAPFGQSKGHWSVRNLTKLKSDTVEAVNQLWLGDWYHAFLDAKIGIQMLFFVVAYLLCFCAFAAVWLMVSDKCGLELHGSFARAYMLSMESMMTIGYGVPDPYMHGCWQGAVVLTMQTLLQCLMGACLIGVIFQGISRPQARACTILFSERAAIRCIDGVYYLIFRICDLRTRHALIEAHVRCYCVQRHPIRGYEMIPLRLEHPDDDLGAALVLTLPYVVVHRIDAWSPLAPTRELQSANTRASVKHTASCGRTDHDAYRTPVWPGVLQRQVDAEGCNRDSCLCPTCGETFATPAMLQLHCQYNAVADKASEIPPESAHYELQAADLAQYAHMDPSREELEKHLSKGYREVVVLVEGIEPTTSSTLQARHSYVISGTDGDPDLAWDMDFADCCRAAGDGKQGLGLDLGRFHMLVPCVS